MKKLIVIFFALIVLLCGCGKKVGESFTDSDRFIIVSGSNDNAPYYETIIADKNTGVLYLVIYTVHHCGITPLIDENGTPLLWEDWEK